jgi:hypothetical protein
MSTASVMLLAAFLLIVAVAWVAMRREQDASLSWPEATGMVVAVDAAPAVGRGTGRRERFEAWQPQVVYDYEVRGRRYTGERLKLDPAHARMSRSEVDDLLRFYRPGMPVRVRYDPKRPERAVLIPGRG